MREQSSSPKITPRHLARRAIVYLRQSSAKQVRENLESQRLQYGLVDRARDLGWDQIETIDTDLGSSASIGAARREGFDRVIGTIARGEVGVVLSREVSRLSRTDKDWCHLLEVCQVFDTLIGDEEQIYDLSQLDDQLVLGIKGTMSVVELKVLKMRMLRGAEEKAKRGELAKRLPSGYVRDADNRVVKNPDTRIQEAIALVFRKFRELWSVRQTFMWFRDQAVELPVQQSQGSGMRLVWQLPTQSFIREVLRNPFYGGAYVYGRRPLETVLVDGELTKRTSRMRPPEECRVFIADHHEGYIDWQTYEEIQEMTRRNNSRTGPDVTVAAVRSGQGLLAGLLRCARCGRKLHVRYWGKSGTSARYLCKGDFDDGGEYCLAFGGRLVDRRFSEEILRVISPLGLQASLEALTQLEAGDDELRRALELQRQQLAYEVQRAFEQYDEVDPRNRLVAGELERRWNLKLEELDRVQQAVERLNQEKVSLTEEDTRRLLVLGEDFSRVWNVPGCPIDLKKKILRTVLEEIVAGEEEDGRTLRFILHWKGGTHTEIRMPRPQSPVGRKTSMEALEIIRKMAPQYGDDQIAAVLNQLGHRTGKEKRWNQTRVSTARRNHSISGHRRVPRDPEVLSLTAAARYCRVSHRTIERMVESGHLKMHQVVPKAPWEIRRTDLDAEPVHSIVEHLLATGKLRLEGGRSADQKSLFTENKGDDNARYCE